MFLEGFIIWICGDCYVGNFGFVGDVFGVMYIQIWDMDQIVLGNFVYDLIWFGVLLVMVVCGFDFFGIVIVCMVEVLMVGYLYGIDLDVVVYLLLCFVFVYMVMKVVIVCMWKELVKDWFDGMFFIIFFGCYFWLFFCEEWCELK